MSKVIVGILIVMALVAGLVVSSSWLVSAKAADTVTGLNVRILVYSGRPDPEFVLDTSSDRRVVDQLRQILHTLPDAPAPGANTVIPAILGYKGIRVVNDKRLGELPEAFAVYRGNVELRDDTATRFKTDESRSLETLLLNVALERNLVDKRLLLSEDLTTEGGPDAQRENLRSGMAEPQETRGAPYPAVAPDFERTPNVEGEEPWKPVPDGPVRGDMKPQNPPAEIRPIDVDSYPKDKQDDEEGS